MAQKDPEARKKYHQEYYRKNKEKLDAYKQQWKAENPEKSKKHQTTYTDKSKEKRQIWQREYRYGLSHEVFTKMLEEQSGSCKICERLFEGTKVFVDHCHSTGSVRGLLCPSCNTALGLIKDNLLWLQRAKTYLTENP
jgi:hypothetical protein